MRIVIIAAILLFIAFLNFITVRTLLAAHPDRRAIIWTLFAIGNLAWLVLPFLFGMRSTPFSIYVRPFLAPPWFSWILFVLLYCALTAVVTLAWLPFRFTQGTQFVSFMRPASLAFLAISGGLAVVGYFQAIFPLRTEQVTIRHAQLPPEIDGYRMVVISDLHVGLFTRPSRLRTIADRTNALSPDVVLFTGDLVDDTPHWAPKLFAGFTSLRAPSFAILGNHDGNQHELIRRFEGARTRLLVNEGSSLKAGLWLAGLSDYSAAWHGEKELMPNFDRALEGRPEGAFTVLMSHQPNGFTEAAKRRIPLTISGHTHGGQAGIRALDWCVAGIFLKYRMGLYREGDSQLCVNTGTGYWVVPIRPGMTPEITLITLRRE